jgi:hypothetical protein
MSGDAPKEAVDNKSESKSTEEQSSLWADIARDMAIGAGLGTAVAGPFGTIVGTEAGLAWGLITHSSEAIESAKHLFESVKELAENPMILKAIKETGQPLMLPDPAKELVEEKTEGFVDKLTKDPVRTAAEILFPPLLIYDFVTGSDKKE